MTFPWVARSTLLAVATERDWLREQLAQALGHNRRLERVEAGRPELPSVVKKPREPMPPDVRQSIDAWQSETTKSRLELEAWRRYERDGHWDGVLAELSAAAAE